MDLKTGDWKKSWLSELVTRKSKYEDHTKMREGIDALIILFALICIDMHLFSLICIDLH